MNYSELKEEIVKLSEMIANMEDTESVEVHCMHDQLSAMEEDLETMLPE